MRFAIAAGLCAAIVPATFAGPIIDFETYNDGITPLENGRQLSTVAGLWEQGLFTLVSDADLTNGGGRAAIFDTSDPGPNVGGPDPDLLVNLGNCLITQTNNPSGHLTQGVSGIYDTPNDEADGSTLIFNFTAPSFLESADFIDINGGGNFDLILEDINGFERTFDVPNHWTNDIDVHGPAGWQTLYLNTLASQPGEGGGIATASEDPGFNQVAVVKMTLTFSGSAGIDNLAFVPAPGAGAALGALALAAMRRRRR